MIRAVVKLTLAPTFTATEALAVGVFRLPAAFARPTTVRVLARLVAPSTVSVPSVSIAVDVMNVLTVLLPTLMRAAVRLTFAPTFTAVEALAVGVFRLPAAFARPTTVKVFERFVAPRTVSVPSVSIAVDVMNVLTVELPTLTRAVVRLTLAPTFTATEAFAVGVFILPESVVSPVTPSVFERVAAPVTLSVFERVALPVTASVFDNVTLPVTISVLDNVALPVTAIVFAKFAFDVMLAAPFTVR